MRHLVIILGDQLDSKSSAFDGFDPQSDAVWMAEVREESTHVRSHKVRTAYFLSAMRHFRDELRERGWTVHYRALDDRGNKGSLAAELAQSIRSLKPQKLIVTEPGEFRVRELLRTVATEAGKPLEERVDRHFFSTIDQFRQHAQGRKQLRLEFFYRDLRRATGLLMNGSEPEGGQWNFDAENRAGFGKQGPGLIPPPRDFEPDDTTRAVLKLVEREFADHPGDLSTFDWPVTSTQALNALDDFIRNRLPDFGRYQDAMWTHQPYLYHSRLSAAMNLKLLDPRIVCARAEAAYRNGDASLAAVEGFIRQILGWREYVRGLYWHLMPEYAERNALNARIPLPEFFWTGQTDMNCLRDCLSQTLQLGYAHHIQRLMVTGLYALMLGVEPRQIHEWYLGVYVDAVEWVELPNVLGMSQYADGGIMASKPYVATGKYIDRMSNYCKGCRYDPSESVGDDACPFTTLYWDFLMRHEPLLKRNQRMSLQVRNLERLKADVKKDIRKRAEELRRHS